MRWRRNESGNGTVLTPLGLAGIVVALGYREQDWALLAGLFGALGALLGLARLHEWWQDRRRPRRGPPRRRPPVQRHAETWSGPTGTGPTGTAGGETHHPYDSPGDPGPYQPSHSDLSPSPTDGGGGYSGGSDSGYPGGSDSGSGGGYSGGSDSGSGGGGW